MAFTIPAVQPQLFKVPAQRFKQGYRTVFAFALDLAQLDSILPQRVEEDVVRDANRRLTPSHAKKIEQYLIQSDDWVLGAILLGIEPSALDFVPFKDDEGNESQFFGELRIPFNRMSTFRLFDGQHRRRAIQDALAGLRDSEKQRSRLLDEAKENEAGSKVIQNLSVQLSEIRDKREELEQHSVPIVLYQEGDIMALRRMFADAAKTKPIEAVTRARFDDRDPFNRAAYEVADQSEFFRGRIEMERNTVARTSPNLLSFNQLSTILKTLMFGYYGRVSRVRSLELEADHEPALRLGIEWADDFLPSASKEYQELLKDESEDEALIPTLRQHTFAFNAIVFRVLAACFHGWKENMDQDIEPLARYIRDQSFNSAAKDSFLIRAGLIMPGTTSPVGRRQEVQKAIQYILQNAKRYIGS